MEEYIKPRVMGEQEGRSTYNCQHRRSERYQDIRLSFSMGPLGRCRGRLDGSPAYVSTATPEYGGSGSPASTSEMAEKGANVWVGC